ncbi:MAG: GNAT family N-acetyltransferase [Hyphomicrobiales bacterium]
MGNHGDQPAKAMIRTMTDADRDAVLSLVRELQAHESTVYDRMIPPEEITATYLDRMAADCQTYDGVVLVAVKGDRVVGYASVMRRAFDESYDEVPFTYAYVADLVVSDRERGSGIGRGLLEACEAEARAAGQAWMRISVLAKNIGAHGLYRSFGFNDHLVTLEKPLKEKT